MRRAAYLATIATHLLLLAALVAWQWLQRQPVMAVASAGSWRVPMMLAVLSLGAGAVALIACRRQNLVLLFLLDFVAVLAAAWLFNHLYRQAPMAALWLR